MEGCLQASREGSGWPGFLKEGLASFINLGSSGGAGGGTEGVKAGGGGGRESDESRKGALSAVQSRRSQKSCIQLRG